MESCEYRVPSGRFCKNKPKKKHEKMMLCARHYNLLNKDAKRNEFDSIFKIEIKTNLYYDSENIETFHKIKKIMLFLFNNENIKTYLKDVSNPFNINENIINIETDFFIYRTNKLNACGMVKLKHSGFYQMNFRLMRDLFNKMLGSKVSLTGSAINNIDEWIERVQQQNNKLN